MSYVTVDESPELGKPIELFLFSSQGFQLAYTTSPTEVVYNGVTYIPNIIEREEPVRTAQIDTKDFLVTLPATDPLVNPRYVLTVPSNREFLTIYRKHVTDAEVITYWSGEIGSVSFSDEKAKISCRPVTDIIDHAIPRRSYSNQCSHVLFDVGCKLLKSNFDTDVTVTQIGADYIDVTAPTLDTFAADYFVTGMIKRGSYDFRMILTQTDIGINQLRLGILLSIPDLVVGAILTIFAGCDHTLATCSSAKFSNAVNYGGFPWIPSRNPFEGIE